MHRSRVRPLAAVAALSAAALLSLAACGSSGTASASSSSNSSSSSGGTKLVIGIAPAAAYVPVLYGVDHGYFKKQGLDATIQQAAGGAALVPEMQAGSVQIGGSNLLSVLQAQQKGLDMKCVSGAYVSNTSSLMGSPKTGTSIKTGTDLEGKTVAVNALASATQLAVEKWVKDTGGDPTKVHFVAIGFSDQASALESGQADAALTDEPFTSQMIDAGYPVIDKHPADSIKQNVTFGCWVGLGSWISGHASQVKAFSTALNNVNTYLAQHPDVFRAALVQYLKVSKADAAASILPDVTTQLTDADFTAWQNAALSFGLLSGPVNLSKVNGGFSGTAPANG
jgi:NitT/TauT family transport system substrate-binding protein